MGCCHAGDSKDKGEVLLLHTEPEKQHELQETIKEISSQQPVSRAELNSKIESSSVNNNNLPNSKKLAASHSSKNDHTNNNNNFSSSGNNNNNNAQTALDKHGSGLANKESSASLVKDRVETQTDAKHPEEKIGTQVSQDINHDDNYDNDDDDDSEQEDVVNDIIDNLIKQNINSMNN